MWKLANRTLDIFTHFTHTFNAFGAPKNSQLSGCGSECLGWKVLLVTNRLIAIGDIHGCSTALRALITAIAPDPDDTIVTLGDYVDRGPDVKGVVELLLDLKNRCNLVPILGNHEEMMLRVIEGKESHQDWLRFGGVETLESYGFDGDLHFLPPEHMEFFRSLKESYLQDNYFFTHAAYDPLMPLDEHREKCSAGIPFEMVFLRRMCRG